MENLTRQKNTAPQEQEAVSKSRNEKALNSNFASKQITTMNFRKSQPVSQNRGKKELLR